jgi:integrase/recombinase XerD
MAKNCKVGIFARLRQGGKQRTVKVEWAGNVSIIPIVGAIYWLRWEHHDKTKYLRIGPDHKAAVAALLTQETFLAEQRYNPETTAPVRRALAAAMSDFLLEKPDPVKRANWKLELDQFVKVCHKFYLDQIDRADIFTFIEYWRAEGVAPRTVFNRTTALGTFLRWAEVVVKFRFSIAKNGGDIPNFINPAVNWYEAEELVPFFNACTPDEKMVFLFFLGSGGREREVTFACWSDIDFAKQIFTIQPKPDLPFYPQSMETRLVPLDDKLVAALRLHWEKYHHRRLLFESPKGKPEIHFLLILKNIARRAGLNCGRCVKKNGTICAKHSVCDFWTLHKFRRTWATWHLRAGVTEYELMEWIGHTDVKILKRYAAAAGVSSPVTMQKVNKTFAAHAF